MYANEFKNKGKPKNNWNKKLTATYTTITKSRKSYTMLTVFCATCCIELYYIHTEKYSPKSRKFSYSN